MVKLYVGARRRVFVTGAGAGDYQLCANGAAASAARVAFTILADHLGDRERALAARGHIERIFGARLRAPFWTLTERELDDALTRAGEAGK
jgi:hypothetical protein